MTNDKFDEDGVGRMARTAEILKGMSGLTDEELSDIALGLDSAALRAKERLVNAFRRQRALLRKLVIEEGCPFKTFDDGDVCGFCGGTEKPDEPGEEPAYNHTADCIWLELEREVKG